MKLFQNVERGHPLKKEDRIWKTLLIFFLHAEFTVATGPET